MKVITFAWKMIQRFGPFKNVDMGSEEFAEFLIDCQGDIITNDDFRKRNEKIISHKSKGLSLEHPDHPLNKHKNSVGYVVSEIEKLPKNSPEFEEVIHSVIVESRLN